MTEERYRLYKLLLLTTFVVGALIIGLQFSLIGWQMSENGRYVQLDRQKNLTVMPGQSEGSYNESSVIDTRNGNVQTAPDKP